MSTRQALGLAALALDVVIGNEMQYDPEWQDARRVIRHMLEQERNPMTETQKQIVQFIDAYIEAHGYSPTYEEIRVYFGWASKHTVTYHLRPLKARGYITSRKGSARSLKILA